MSQQLGTQPNPVMPPFAQSLQGRLVKLVIAFVFYVGHQLIEWTRALLGHDLQPTVVAIFYHQLPREQRGRFARQMDHLLRWTVPIVTDRTEPLSCGARYAMVTADDGWRSFIENALPELERRRIPVTIFVVSDYLGRSLGQRHDRLATKEELSRLGSELVSVGSHTSTHARLTALDEDAAWSELRDSRTTLETLLNREVRLFSFPFGAYNCSLVSRCRNAGYKRAFLGTPSSRQHQPQDFVTGRIRVDPTDWSLEFHLKLMGAYSWLPWAIRLKSRLAAAIRTGPYLAFRLTGCAAHVQRLASRGWR
jgi:peptidoglycan/xylan/chitin deacetylase (PgdA/CDA1 family)